MQSTYINICERIHWLEMWYYNRIPLLLQDSLWNFFPPRYFTVNRKHYFSEKISSMPIHHLFSNTYKLIGCIMLVDLIKLDKETNIRAVFNCFKRWLAEAACWICEMKVQSINFKWWFYDKVCPRGRAWGGIRNY